MMIPNQSYFFSGIVVTLYFLFLFSFVLHTLASPKLHHCRHDQRDALLEFKHEFPGSDMISKRYHDISSWNKSSDCCSWKGVTCEAKSGKVISLDLNTVALNNTLKPNSGLFKLQYLQELALFNCHLYGEIPSSFGNLSHLTELDLMANALDGQVPASIGNLTQLRYMYLVLNQLSGKASVSFANLTKLITLDLGKNDFEPEFLPDMSRFQNLEGFSGGNFFGPFPTSFFTIPSLQFVNLGGNNFMGPIDFGNITLSSQLQFLDLADNKLDSQIPESISKFLKLRGLDLSNNKLEGKVPGCLLRLPLLKLSHNSFSSFGKSSEVLFHQKQMYELRLDSNSFHGPFPHWICQIRLLHVLDLSKNSFNGSIYPCLRNFTDSLRVLNLRNNKFSGILPDVFVNATNLSELDVSRNRLEGKLPKTLINCEAMEFFNVEGNKFKDKFPSWLGSLSSLNVISLRSNQFYGSLYHPHISIGFQNIKVIDVSHNDFAGTFPAFYFSNWFEMRRMTTLNTKIDGIYMNYRFNVSYVDYGDYNSSMEMVHKGVDTNFERIRRDFTAIDFSRNKFYGKIPESIGLLRGLHLLNLSGNAFTSDIPQSLANLTNLEALDLSQNQLSGQIPRDLGTLNFLSTMNFSYNNLEGPIPQSTQFQRQNCSSFMKNPKLNGFEEICGKTHVPNPQPQESEEVSEPEENVIHWVAAAIAYGPGVFCGLVIGHIFSSHKHQWFMERFRRNYKPNIIFRSAR